MMPLNANRPPVSVGRAAVIGTRHTDYSPTANTLAIATALALKPTAKACWQGQCPACGYADAFSLSVKDGKLLWHCHACGDGEGIQHCLQGLGLLGGGQGGFHAPMAVLKRPAARSKADTAKQADKLAFIRRLWAESQPLTGAACAYLQSRGLVGPYPDSLRFLPSCWHTPTATEYPAIVAAVTRWPSAEVVAVHRTYFKPDGSGKIEHPQARMMLGDASGGAVRLAEVGGKLALAEGIETALSVQQVSGIPTWACLSTSGMQGIILPDAVREVVICADHDPPGLVAANAAAERLTRQGRLVKIARPPQPDTDFNDMLKGASHD